MIVKNQKTVLKKYDPLLIEKEFKNMAAKRLKVAIVIQRLRLRSSWWC